MTKSNLLLIAEFEDFWADKEYYAAFDRLADIVLSSGVEFKSTREFKELRLRVVPNQEIIDLVNTKVASNAARIHHILSTGEGYNEDERLLILTLVTSIINVHDVFLDMYQIEILTDIPELRKKVTEKLKKYQMRGIEAKLFDQIRI